MIFRFPKKKKKIESGIKETVVNELPHTWTVAFIFYCILIVNGAAIECDMNDLLVSDFVCVYSILMGNFPTSVNCMQITQYCGG